MTDDSVEKGGHQPSARSVPTVPWPLRQATRSLSRLRRRSIPWKVVDRIERWAFSHWLAPQLVARPDLRLVRLGQDLRLVENRAGLDVADVAQENLDLVVEACETAGIEHFLLRTPQGAPFRIGVRASDRDRLLTALLGRHEHAPVYLSYQVRRGGSQRQRTQLIRLVDPATSISTSPVWAVHRYVREPASGVQFGVRHACEIEFWSEDEQQNLCAPRANRTTSRIAPEQLLESKVDVRGRRYRTLRPFSVPTTGDVTFPIDAVYTWVDGSDPRWLARKSEVLRALGLELGTTDHKGSATSRFRDHDELRYSLRSLQQFAPWIRHVYLVTDRQVPEWLDASSRSLTVVDHTEIFGDSGRLPTFNSHAISARLHHIQGLAEHYLLINDDVFFGRPVDPGLFFLGNGMSKFFLSKATIPAGPISAGDPPHEAARKRAAQLIERDFGVVPTRAFKHTPVPQRRSIHLELEKRYPEAISRTLAHQFRDTGDVAVASWLHHYYGYATAQAIPATISYDYFRVTRRDALTRMSRLLTRRYADCFCLNDFDEDEIDDDERISLLNEFLTTYFPFASPFEKIQAPDVQPHHSAGFEELVQTDLDEAADSEKDVVAAADSADQMVSEAPVAE